MSKWFALSHSRRFAIGLWIALLAGVLGRVAFDKVTAQTVLPIYLEGGRRWENAEPLYGPMPAGLDVIRNPPLIAALTVPFTELPPRFAALLWRILLIGLYALGLFQFLRDVAPPISALRRDIFWMLGAVLVLNAFNNAQLNLLIVASALLGVAAAARGHWWVSAFWLTLSGQVKIYPFALAGLVCVAFPRTMIWRTALMLIAGLLLPCVLANPQYALDQYRSFAITLKADDRTDVAIERTTRDWSILPRSFAGVIVPREVVLPVAAIAGIAFAFWVALANREERLRLAFSLGILWMLLFGPNTEMNTYSILAPVAAWLACRERSGVFAWLGVSLLLAAILRASFPTNLFHGLEFLQPIAAICLLVAALAGGLHPSRKRQRRFETPSEPEA